MVAEELVGVLERVAQRSISIESRVSRGVIGIGASLSIMGDVDLDRIAGANRAARLGLSAWWLC
jgi:hypothetical protein